MYINLSPIENNELVWLESWLQHTTHAALFSNIAGYSPVLSHTLTGGMYHCTAQILIDTLSI